MDSLNFFLKKMNAFSTEEFRKWNRGGFSDFVKLAPNPGVFGECGGGFVESRAKGVIGFFVDENNGVLVRKFALKIQGSPKSADPAAKLIPNKLRLLAAIKEVSRVQ